MTESCGEAKFSLKLVVDEEKNKVVFAEACSDFVDVLFSFLTLPVGTIVRLLEEHRKERVSVGCFGNLFSLLTLPMGTIVRLLEKHRKSESVSVGCFGNLYKSVVDMGIENFETEACKEILVNPRSVKEVQCKRLKLNINPTDDLKSYRCFSFTDCKLFSNFSTSLCRCDELMSREIEVSEVKVVDNNRKNGDNGVFVRGRSAFIITDDLKVAVRSTDIVLKKLKSLGCGNVSKLGERLIDVGFEEVLSLLECIFSSNAPLTDAFLNKQAPRVPKFYDLPIPCMKKIGDEAEPEEVITLDAIVRKQDMRILYVECGEDFADLLFTFLAVPLGSVLDISGNGSSFGCIGNLFKSSRDLSATEVTTSEPVLPYYYKCQKQLLNVIIDQPLSYYYYKVSNYMYNRYVTHVDRLTTNCNEICSDTHEKAVPVVLVDPKAHGRDHSPDGSGFAKKNKKFTVSDDLIITPMNSSSTFCLLRKLQIQAEDLEVQEISITKAEATSLLRAALVTSSPLNAALKNLILKKSKKETLKNPKKET